MNSLFTSLFGAIHRRSERAWSRRVKAAVDTDDLWRLFERRVPRVVGEYYRGGAGSEATLRDNVLAFRQERVNPFGARKFGALDMSTTVVGHQLSVPWFVAPVGSLRALWPHAESLAAKVAGEFGTVMTLSTLSGTPMEEVAAASTGKCWFQLYLCGGREAALRGIERARKSGYTALALTIDTGVAGNRNGHARMKPMEVVKPFSGLSLKDKFKLACLKLGVLPQMITHLSWLVTHYYDGGLMRFVNVILDDGTTMPYADIGKQLASSAVTWDDFGWIKAAWGDAPLIVKGVHNAEDAKRAEAEGASGVIFSNHGGRQQDRALASLQIVKDALPRLADSKLDFMMDGGIRNGTDVFVALAHGLKAVGLGRVCAAGLGAAGYAGMRRSFDILQAEFDLVMRLVGVDSVQKIREGGVDLLARNGIIGADHFKPVLF